MSSLRSRTLDADIAIVGAGVAGLATAKALRASGRSCVLLEASHRIGGRAYTEMLRPDIPFDLGAHWIHCDELNPFMAIAKEHGAVLERDDEDYTLAEHFADGAWLPRSAGVDISDFYEQQFERVASAARNGDTRSVFEIIDNDSPWAAYFYLFFGQDYTCDVDMPCVQDVDSYTRRGVDYAVATGFGKLVGEFGAKVPVQLNCAVQAIDWSGAGVRVKTNKGELRVGKVIVTVSTGVLANRQIEFTPALPDWKRAAIAGLPMGSCTRIALRYDKPLLADLPDDFTVRMGDAEPVHFRNRPCGHDFAEITVGGRLAEWMEKSGERAALDLVVAQLRHLLGEAVSLEPQRHVVTAWDGDAWTRGSYSYAKPGMAAQRDQLRESLDDKVFFAGEATSKEHFATVHGAYFSAQDVLAQV